MLELHKQIKNIIKIQYKDNFKTQCQDIEMEIAPIME